MKWSEAWDLIVNYNKKCRNNNCDKESYIYFDSERKIFIDENNESYYSFTDNDDSWEEYIDTVKFQWRTHEPPVGIEIIAVINHKKVIGTYWRSSAFLVTWGGITTVHHIDDIEKWSYIPEDN